MAGKRLTPAQKLEIIALRTADPRHWTYQALGEHFGCDKETAWRAFHRQPSSIRPGVKDPEVVPPPKLWAELSQQARDDLEDFRAWRYRHFDREAPAFQLEMIDSIVQGENSVTLVPPGHGKSTLITHDFVIWDMLRYRVRGEFYSCLLISSAADMARGFLGQIRATLERNTSLQDAYGSFRPEMDATWKRDALSVWWPEHDAGRSVRKEPTFIAAGRSTRIYGWRVRRIIVDDLIGKDESLSPEATAATAEWLHEVVESRLNSRLMGKGGGRPNIAYVGTRFSPHEVYSHLLAARNRRGEPLYRQIIYRAHDASKCSGVDCDCEGPCEHHPSYPEGCTLWPQAWPYPDLMHLRDSLDQTRAGRFDFVYNQEETPQGETLCEKDWVERCKDRTRGSWTLPQDGRAPGRVICTLDPSAANWVVLQAWAYVPALERLVDVACHYLIAMVRRRMTGPQIVAAMKDMTLRLRGLGVEPTWIVEMNAFQKWLIQFNDFRQMRLDIGGLTVIPHSTGVNKLDPEFGVGELGPIFEYGKVSIPWAVRSDWDAMAPFVKELVSCSRTGSGETNDTIMAAWFYIHHVKKMAARSNDQAFLAMPDIPPYLLSRQRQVPMFA